MPKSMTSRERPPVKGSGAPVEFTADVVIGVDGLGNVVVVVGALDVVAPCASTVVDVVVVVVVLELGGTVVDVVVVVDVAGTVVVGLIVVVVVELVLVVVVSGATVVDVVVELGASETIATPGSTTTVFTAPSSSFAEPSTRCNVTTLPAIVAPGYGSHIPAANFMY
jgi:hypothetical protein